MQRTDPNPKGGNSTRLRHRTLTLSLIALLSVACYQRAPLPKVLSERLAANPTQILDLSFPMPEETVFTWDLGSEEETSRWNLSELTESRSTAEGLEVLSRSHLAKLTREVDLIASSIDVIELDLMGERNSSSFLAWAGEDEDFSPERSVHIGPDPKAESESRTLSFRVAEHALWRNRIDKLALVPSAAEEQRISLQQIRGLRYSLDNENAAAILGSSWWIDLAGDVRTGLVSLPLYRHQFRSKIPRDAELRISHGLDETTLAAIDYRILIAVDGSEELIFEARREPEVSDLGWRQEKVSLSRFAGREVDVVLETLSDGSARPFRCLAFWANPEIWSRPDAEHEALAGRPNVVLISLDTLRADRMSLYGNERPTTAQDEAWARERGVVFGQAVAAAPWTLPSHVSMLSGIDSLHHGVNFDDPVPSSIDMLAERLSSAGYATTAITEGGYLHPRFGFLQGFDRYVHSYTGVEEPDRLVAEVEAASEFLSEHRDSGPFFLFFHTYAIHDPYRPRQPFFGDFGGQEEFEVKTERYPWKMEGGHRLQRYHLRTPSGVVLDKEPETIEAIRLLYDSGVAWADRWIGELLESIDHENTVVIVTSDHGEALGEHGAAGHAHLFDDTILVPLVISLPGGSRAVERIEEQVLSVDIVPTILDLVAGSSEAESEGDHRALYDGQSLVPEILGKKSSSAQGREA